MRKASIGEMNLPTENICIYRINIIDLSIFADTTTLDGELWRLNMSSTVKRVRVVSDPEIMSGDPCIEGTRIPVESIIANLKAGYPLTRILEAYPTLPPGGVEAAIEWAEENGMDWRC